MKKQSTSKSPNSKTPKMPFADADASLAAAIGHWWNVNADAIVEGDHEMVVDMLRRYTHDGAVFIPDAKAQCAGNAQVAERALRIIEALARGGRAADAAMIYDICQEAGEVNAAQSLRLHIAKFNDPHPFYHITDDDLPF